MKKSVAITTIVALHAAVIGMLLVQAGCSSEPSTEAKPAKASATVEEINSTETAAAKTEALKEVIPAEGSQSLRAAPTRPAWNMSGQKQTEIVSPAEPVKPAEGELVKPAAPDGSLVSYKVQKGDTLAKIAKHNKVSLNDLLKANNFTRTSVIHVGQEISLPASAAPAAPSAEVPSAVNETPAPAKAAVSAPVAVSGGETVAYVVKKGDSLGRIAKEYKTSVKSIMELNNLKNHNIRVGQKLNVSKSGAPSVVSAASAPAVVHEAKASKTAKAKASVSAGEGEVSHTVKSGETLGVIARKYGTSVSAIAERNGISDPRKLKVGQVLIIKTSKVSAETKTAEAKKPADSALPSVEKETPAASPTAPAAVVPQVVEPANVQPVAPANAPVPSVAPTSTDTIPVVEL